MKKIALICNTLGGGGAEQVMSSLGLLFKEKGNEVDFIVARGGGVYSDKVSKYASIINLNSKARYLVPRLYKYLKTSAPDIILSTQSHINIATIISSKMAGIKSVVREATTPSVAFAVKNPYLKQPVKWSYKYASKVVSVSDGVKRDLINNFNIRENHIKTIYNPIISSELYDKANQEVDHPWFSLDIPIIVSMGRFAKAKDYPTLIRAFSIIRKEVECKLIILGDTESDKSVKKEVLHLIDTLDLKSSIDLVGFQSNPFPFIKNASLYILSSIYEGLPGALIQAVALGCNIVSTDCESGPREILEKANIGKLVKVKDHQTMADESIKQLLNTTKSISPNNDFLNAYSTDGISDQYLNLFEELYRV